MEMTFVAIILILLVVLVMYFEIKKKDTKIEASNTESNRVEITDIRMPFGSMVVFMVKWAIASIPAIIILYFLFMLFGGVVTGIFASMGHM